VLNGNGFGSGSVTYGSLYDPNFSFEEGDDTHDDFYRVPESRVQKAGEGWPEEQRHLLRGDANQLRRNYDPRVQFVEMSDHQVRLHTLARGMIATKLNANRTGASQFK
jgi:hypothetical protein